MIRIWGRKKPNTEQLKHAAGTLRAVALALFGLLVVPSLLKGQWLVMSLALIQAVGCELIAVRLLASVKEDR